MYDEVKQPKNWKKIFTVIGAVVGVLLAVVVGLVITVSSNKEEERESIEYLNYGESDLNITQEEVSWFDKATDFEVKIKTITDSTIYAKPSIGAEQLGVLKTGEILVVVAQCYSDNRPISWFRIDYAGNVGYISTDDIEYVYDMEVEENESQVD